MLAELVEVVIGVDTHKDTHTAAVLDVRTGGVLARTALSRHAGVDRRLRRTTGRRRSGGAWWRGVRQRLRP
jgi:hypothetical protein